VQHVASILMRQVFPEHCVQFRNCTEYSRFIFYSWILRLL